MLTARIMTDNTPGRGLETPIDSEQGPDETTGGGFMEMILRRSPFATGVMTRAKPMVYLDRTGPTIDPLLRQPEEEAIYDMETGMMFLPPDVRLDWASKGPGT
jgi:hypothetical protein